MGLKGCTVLNVLDFDSTETQDIEFTFINLFFTTLYLKIDKIN